MRTALLLRIASMIALLFAAGHTLGGMQSWSPLGETDVLQAMRTFRFETEGVSRTYLDFYRGFGFILSVFLLMQSVLLWQLAGSDRATARRMVLTLLCAAIVTTILSWRFIFPLPAYFGVALSVCLALALAARR